ncbi:MAG TPA: protein kinase, partial [Clostridia bacterium]|nr:protein kinase [Clostridia bacterium]
MDSESSSFDNIQDFSPLINSFSDIVPVDKNGATSDCFKVRIHAKWHFLKRPKKAFSTNPLYIAAFEKEFDLGFTLEHPNIVRYLSKGTDKDGIYILTEYIDGQTLSDFRLKNPDFFKGEENIRKLLLQLLSALDYLHNRQIVHLDLKPDNILITNNGSNIKLIDLGLSYSDCYSEITGGTQSFGSPEQFFKPNLIDYRSDLYAFGKIVLYLFNGNTQIRSIGRLPARYKELVNKCLVEDVERRNIKADECIKLINHKNRFQVLLVVGIVLILSLFLFWTNRMRTSHYSTKQPNIPKHDTILIKQSPANSAIQNFKQKVTGNGLVVNPTIKGVNNQSKDSVEKIIRLAIKRRLTPSKSALTTAYSDINEFNVSILRKLFEDWKNQCNDDCKLLYEDYQSEISFQNFKSIYNEQLNIINTPIQKRLDEFIQSSKQKVTGNNIVIKPTKKRFDNQLKDSVEEIIRLATKRRLTPISALLGGYTDITEFN